MLVAWLAIGFVRAQAGEESQREQAVKQLAEEVRSKGWIVFCARSPSGDWDLFVCRPDGSQLRNITRTPEHNEAAPQFSRDGRQLLYRRLGRAETIDGNHYGAQGQLMIARSDGSGAQPFGASGEYPWASWSADGKQLACLDIKGVFFVDVAGKQVSRRLERKGFFQQLVWSPDGLWLCGVSNAFGTGWSVARIEASSGKTNAVSCVDCCTPDWFPDSRQIVFSYRPPGQKSNNGYGWTQLWRADAEGKQRQLVYAEQGRHVYGGHVSPDGKYVLFTGNMREDGDPGNAGAPMGLIRLSDAPIVFGGGEPRAAYPHAKEGPVLHLPQGWEPCWTLTEIFQVAGPGPGTAPAASGDAPGAAQLGRKTAESAGGEQPQAGAKASGASGAVERLAAEVRRKGWIVFSAATERGDWDLWAMRPDGLQRRRLTDTAEYNEAGPRFSPGGSRLLYFRIPKSEPVDNNTYGTYELVVARADGSAPVAYGNGFPWACWGADDRHVAILAKAGVEIIELENRKPVQRMPRKGMVQQLAWSPDGNWFAATTNGLGPYWNIGRMDARSGRLNVVSDASRYNCTPDWLPDSRRIIYSRGIVPEHGGWAELWCADGDGKNQRLIYAEQGRHIYGGCTSPDGNYVLFTRSEADLGRLDNSRTRMALIRWADTPMVAAGGKSLRQQHPQAKDGPLLDLSWGWEPHWTYTEVFPPAQAAPAGRSTPVSDRAPTVPGVVPPSANAHSADPSQP